MRKTDFCLCKNKDTNQLCSNCTADQRLCFRYSVLVQSLFFLNPKFQASSLLLYRLVCVRARRKPGRPVFSHHSSSCCLAAPAAKQLRRNGNFSSICGVFSFNLWGFPLTARGLVSVVIFCYSCRIIKQLKTETRRAL